MLFGMRSAVSHAQISSRSIAKRPVNKKPVQLVQDSSRDTAGSKLHDRFETVYRGISKQKIDATKLRLDFSRTKDNKMSQKSINKDLPMEKSTDLYKGLLNSQYMRRIDKVIAKVPSARNLESLNSRGAHVLMSNDLKFLLNDQEASRNLLSGAISTEFHSPGMRTRR